MLRLIEANKGITCVSLMGGDAELDHVPVVADLTWSINIRLQRGDKKGGPREGAAFPI